MKKNFRGIFLSTFMLFITGALFITSTLIKLYHSSVIILLVTSIFVFILYFAVVSYDEVKLKDIFSKSFLRYLSIAYFFISSIHSLYYFFLLLDNYFYILTPTFIIAYFLFLLIVILSCNTQSINLNLITIISFISSIILIVISFIFPNGTIKITLDSPKVDYYLYSSYFILLLDSFYYGILFRAKGFQLTTRSQHFSLILAMLLILLYSYFDLTIVPKTFLQSFFPNLIKYKISDIPSHIHIDIICLVLMFVACFLKIIIYGQGLRIFTKLTKNQFFKVIIFFLIFAIATLLSYFAPDDYLMTKYIIVVLSNLSLIILLCLGGFNIAKGIHRKKQRQH